MSSYLLEVSGLTKRFSSGTTAVNQLNLALEPGKIVGLLGPNGSGKTTLIKMINGLLTPSSGSILIGGNAPDDLEAKKIIAYLPERTYLQDHMKVCDLVDFFADFYDDFSKEKAYVMLQSLNIHSNDKLSILSKGTKEKVQLILVMSREADLYILDEPIAGVDPAARDYILKTILNNYSETSTILLSTHLISDIENVLDEVVFIKEGELMLHCTVEEIREEKGKSVDAYFREVFAC